MEHKLYRMVYRTTTRGVHEEFIACPVCTSPEAELVLAERIGKAFCALEPNRRFVAVRSAVVADESILADYLPEDRGANKPAARGQAKAGAA